MPDTLNITAEGDSLLTFGDATPVYKYIGWRALHVPEGGRMPIADNMPAVIPPIDQIALPMDEDIQRMSYALMAHFHPGTTPEFWEKQHSHDKAMTNGEQNGYGGGVTLANFITGENTSASLPSYDKKQRTFEGTFMRGIKVGAEIHCQPGVHCIDARLALPSIQTIVENNWYVIATNVGNKNNGYTPSLWAQAYPNWLVFPFISDETIRFETRFFGEWKSNSLPDPVKIYNSPSI